MDSKRESVPADSRITEDVRKLRKLEFTAKSIGGMASCKGQVEK